MDEAKRLTKEQRKEINATFFELSQEQIDYIKSGYEAKQSVLSPYATKDDEAIYEQKYNSAANGLEYIRPSFRADVDRIINNPYFNRGNDKTQVFSLYKNDDISRRGFHVQLVAQNSRKIGEALGLNTSLIEAIGLGHDAGHTPFGHAGEGFLSQIYNEHTGRYFNHNVHSVRALRSVAPCNLSLQTYNGIICHCGENNFAEYTTSPCDTFEELDALMELCYVESGRSSFLRPSTLEGCVVRICDILAYLGKDRQDALNTGIISKSDYYLNSFLGANNSQIIQNATFNIIKNSIGKDRIVMDVEVSDEIRRLKKINFETIYNYDQKEKKLATYILPMMRDIYEKMLDDLLAGNEDSLIFKEHINAWFMQARNSTYIEEEPNDIVVDYIASMTDNYFIELHKHLFPDDAKNQANIFIPYF